MTSWRLGVVGSPVEHSLSPQLHRAGLKYMGFQGTSQRLDIDREHAFRVREVMGTAFDALSLTMPLKEIATSLCDELDERATALGVVNTLLWRDGRLAGASTDGAGFIDALGGEFGTSVTDMHVVVLGSGGAARAIVDSLVREGARAVSVIARNPTSVAKLIDAHPGIVDNVPTCGPIDLVVNTTPSTTRENDVTVMPGVSRDTIAVDITYEPRQSRWLAQYGGIGCRHRNGLAMLAYTVARQMNWWWNSDIPGSFLLTALTEAQA